VPSEARLAGVRAAARLVFKHDPELPIAARREAICAALRRHQVLIVAGDTGSGKSTQLPQFCLEMGRGIDAQIAHTQPRRLAARALAARIAEELSQPLGAAVGFRVRFADQVSDTTRLVLLTDGLLLAELSSDPLLRRYDTIIVDEAHERTLNIDLLLGVLKRLLPRRPDLKLIVTSATLEVERMARFFDDAPIITVSGRNHRIEVRYAEPSDAAEDPDLPLAVFAAYQEIAATPGPAGNGDVLVFLPGEREIRDVGEFLERELDPAVEVLALYSRLSWEQQSRIFQRGSKRRIVLATNVAETSITVPGIRAVIDSGLARMSRYSPRNRLQRLPIEPVSRASAEQRKGRCGRLGPGLCVRLYTEADFEARAAFTEPEVLRTNLAALLLRLAADGLGGAEDFPFIDPPDSRALGDGYRVLQELEALDAERRITRRGRAMARLPLDPRLGRALLESQRFHAEGELLAVVSGLSVPDVRIGSADGGEDPAASAAFEDSKSEFSSLIKLWRAYKTMRQGPRRELKRWCKERGLSLLRLSEWEDVYSQVVDRAAEIGIVAQRKPASYTGVHRALLAGFCTMVGTRGEEGAYLGTRGVHFHIFPGSPLKRRRPRWVMAASIVETSRVFARRVAEVEPMWIEAATQHLIKREYLEPDWDEGREEVVARERISLLGLTLSAGRVVNYGPIAPAESRLIFAREALVYQRLRRRPDWLRSNDHALAAAQGVEERLRRRDLLRAPEFFVEFYDRGLPHQVSSAATLDYFTRHLSAAQRAALTLQPEDVFAQTPDPRQLAQFPARVILPGAALIHGATPEFGPSASPEFGPSAAIEFEPPASPEFGPSASPEFGPSAALRPAARQPAARQRAASVQPAARQTAALTPAALLEPAPRQPPAALPQPVPWQLSARLSVAVPVEYRFAPGEARDGATLKIPLLLLPTLTRATVDAAVPGLVAPRVEALLRSLPKDARRSLIPIAATAAAYIEQPATPSTDPQRLADWLQQSRGLPAALIRFDLDAVPKHLIVQIAVFESADESGGEPGGGSGRVAGGKPADEPVGGSGGAHRGESADERRGVASGEPSATMGGEPCKEPGGVASGVAGATMGGLSGAPDCERYGKPDGESAPRAGADLAAVPGSELAHGTDLGLLRRRFAARARAALDRRAQRAFTPLWRRFEGDLPHSVALDLGPGSVAVYPALARCPQGVRVVYEWSPEEATRTTAAGATALARLMLERPVRDLARTLAADTQLALAASPYVHGDALLDLLLQLVVCRACFQEAGPPRTRAAFEAAVTAGREHLQPTLAAVTATLRTWFTAARALRRLLDDPRARTHGALAEESHAHLRRLLSSRSIGSISMDWQRQLTRYMKAEERRWQRLLARGSEPPQILRELDEWTARGAQLEARVAAEMRWLPQLEEFQMWIEEYRVSLYAQELRTQGPVSAARLGARAAAIDAWITR
jgi:HrpA-like RNA helicase